MFSAYQRTSAHSSAHQSTLQCTLQGTLQSTLQCTLQSTLQGTLQCTHQSVRALRSYRTLQSSLDTHQFAAVAASSWAEYPVLPGTASGSGRPACVSAHTSVHSPQRTSAHISTHQCTPEHTSAHQRTPAHTSAHQSTPAHTRAHHIRVGMSSMRVSAHQRTLASAHTSAHDGGPG